jgi:hypothetical protein
VKKRKEKLFREEKENIAREGKRSEGREGEGGGGKGRGGKDGKGFDQFLGTPAVAKRFQNIISSSAFFTPGRSSCKIQNFYLRKSALHVVQKLNQIFGVAAEISGNRDANSGERTLPLELLKNAIAETLVYLHVLRISPPRSRHFFSDSRVQRSLWTFKRRFRYFRSIW